MATMWNKMQKVETKELYWWEILYLFIIFMYPYTSFVMKIIKNEAAGFKWKIFGWTKKGGVTFFTVLIIQFIC